MTEVAVNDKEDEFKKVLTLTQPFVLHRVTPRRTVGNPEWGFVPEALQPSYVDAQLIQIYNKIQKISFPILHCRAWRNMAVLTVFPNIIV